MASEAIFYAGAALVFGLCVWSEFRMTNCANEGCSAFTKMRLQETAELKYTSLMNSMGAPIVWKRAYVIGAVTALLGSLLIWGTLEGGVRNFFLLFLIAYLSSYSIITFTNAHFFQPCISKLRTYITSLTREGQIRRAVQKALDARLGAARGAGKPLGAEQGAKRKDVEIRI